MDDSSLVPLLTNVEVKIEVEEVDDDDTLIILGFDSVYNNARSNSSSTKPLLTILKPNPNGLMLKCTTSWRCRKCNVNFSTQTDIIQHVQERSCVSQDTTTTITNINTTKATAPPPPPPKESHQTPPPQPQLFQPPSLVQPQSTLNPTHDQQKIYQSYLARKRVPQERQVRLARAAENARLRRANDTEEERETRLGRVAERKRIRTANETEEEREVRLNKLRQAQRLRLLKETEERREARLARMAERGRRRRENESEEQRDARLKKLAQAQKARVASETEEERELRLNRMSEYHRNHGPNSTPSAGVQINALLDASPLPLLTPSPNSKTSTN